MKDRIVQLAPGHFDVPLFARQADGKAASGEVAWVSAAVNKAELPKMAIAEFDEDSPHIVKASTRLRINPATKFFQVDEKDSSLRSIVSWEATNYFWRAWARAASWHVTRTPRQMTVRNVLKICANVAGVDVLRNF